MTNHHAGSATSIDLAAATKLAKALRFFGRFAAETEEQGRLRRCNERTAAADLIDSMSVALARATPQHPEAPAVQSATNIAWGHELQKRLMVADDQGDDDLHNLLGEVACCLASLTGRPDTALTPQHSVTEQASEHRLIETIWKPYVAELEQKIIVAGRGNAILLAENDRLSEAAIRAQPLASTAATQPEQASIKTWWERIQQTNYAGKSRDDLPLTAIVHHAEAEIADLRAALAIPASTAASEQQAGTAPKFAMGDDVRKTKGSKWRGRVVGVYSTSLTPEGYAVESSTESGSVQIYPAAALELVQAAAPGRATTAADQQGDTASASLNSDKEFQRLMGDWSGAAHSCDQYTRTIRAKQAWNALIAYIDGRAQQGAAQAQACDAARYRFVKTMSKEMMLFWRGAYGCADEAIDAAMAAPATTGSSSFATMGDSLQQGPATSGGA